MKDLDRYRGCLIGGAVGDALGYAVEFLPEDRIFTKYGPRGITEYALINGAAQISDDTQMTLFTANGLLLGTTRSMTRGIMGPYPDYINACYEDWLRTQGYEKHDTLQPQHAWLNNIPAMNHPRAPGNTCLSALLDARIGSMEHPLNDSKGCGGVMRVAPIGLYFDLGQKTIDEVDLLAAQAAALTHGNELGYIPAAMLAHIVHLLAHRADMSVLAAVQDAYRAMPRLFPHARDLSWMLKLTDRAITLAADHAVAPLDAIHALGAGWVGDEALAIAMYCAMRFEDDFEQAIIAAVNHSGDSDSTGAITGNILGARLGMKAIPEKFLTQLELKETILEVADDLFHDCRINEYTVSEDPVWAAKYIAHTYPDVP